MNCDDKSMMYSNRVSWQTFPYISPLCTNSDKNDSCSVPLVSAEQTAWNGNLPFLYELLSICGFTFFLYELPEMVVSPFFTFLVRTSVKWWFHLFSTNFVKWRFHLFAPRHLKGWGLRGPFWSICEWIDASMCIYLYRSTWHLYHQDMSHPFSKTCLLPNPNLFFHDQAQIRESTVSVRQHTSFASNMEEPQK
jgi:hypothetical protein